MNISNIITKIKIYIFGVRRHFCEYNRQVDDEVREMVAKFVGGAERVPVVSSHVVTFCDGDAKYKEKSTRLKKELEGLNWFSSVNIHELNSIFFRPEVLSDIDIAACKKFILKNTDVGFGFWVWKPILLYQHLRTLPEGAIVVWADGGCEFSSRGGEVLRHLMYDVYERGSLFFQMPFQEINWTSPSVKSLFVKQKSIVDGPQISATYFLLRNDRETRALVALWMKTCCDDDFKNIVGGRIPLFSRAISHRHDQSILSMIVKKNGCRVQQQFDHFDEAIYTDTTSLVYYLPVHSMRNFDVTNNLQL